MQIAGSIWEFPKIRVPYFGVLIIRILLFGVLYEGPLFSETPIWCRMQSVTLNPTKCEHAISPNTCVHTARNPKPPCSRGLKSRNRVLGEMME